MAVTDEAILSIKAMIISGRLKPGQRLPPEAALADQLGLSRNSLREAVRALALINVLDVRQGDGTYVTSLEPELLLDALTFVVDFHRDESVLEFLRVRRILEPSAAAMAALTIGPTERAELEANLRSSSPDAKPEDLIELDIEFHRLIGVASGNQVLASLIEGLSGPTNRARVWRERTQVGASERTVNEHRAILDAIDAREPDLAHAAMVNHVAGVESWLRRAADGWSTGRPSDPATAD
jgi:GntR family transcriptional regulator, transcriptional repressor for pyruvate dehydrogenase complex